MTSTTTTSGGSQFPPELLSKLTPEQRARLEERMKAKSADKPSTMTYKSCLTQEKLDRASAFGDDQRSCTKTLITSSGRKISLKLECVLGSVKANGTLDFEALSPESVHGTGHMSSAGADHTTNWTANYIGKWIGPACGDVK